MGFDEIQNELICIVNEALERELKKDGIPPLLNESMSYSLFPGGKRLRPCMLLATVKMLGGCITKALPFACALEMIHTYSLIHDDLPAMDNDNYRRGRLTNHMVYGEGQAILAGDGLLSLAFEIIIDAISSSYGEKRFLSAAAAIAKAAGVTGMVGGQCLDLDQEKKENGTLDSLLKVHNGKTVAMFIASMEAGAYCAKADEETTAHLRNFAKNYGLLFQITDDILDAQGDFNSLGKTIGKDASAGKLTFVTFYGLDEAKKQAKTAYDNAKNSIDALKYDSGYFKELLHNTINRKK